MWLPPLQPRPRRWPNRSHHRSPQWWRRRRRTVAGNEPANDNAIAGIHALSPACASNSTTASWIGIRNAAQKIVFVGEYPAGTRARTSKARRPSGSRLAGRLEFALFMGERSIDLKPHTREEVARFSPGMSEIASDLRWRGATAVWPWWGKSALAARRRL